MGGHIIERTNSYRYLGIIVDEKFSWALHIDEICKKLSQVAGVIFRIRTLLTPNALKLVPSPALTRDTFLTRDTTNLDCISSAVSIEIQ